MEAPGSVLDVIRCLKAAGHQAYLVGGCVRDHYLGKEPKDYDVATSARPEQVMGLFPRVAPTGLAFGTVTVLGEEPVEVTTFRGDGEYTDGRHPDTVEFTDDIKVDLARRDFTINAIAYDPIADKIEDPFYGLGDLNRKLIRCVGEPAERFQEDRLRVLRAIRFAVTLEFQIHQATFWAADVFLAKGVGEVAAERRANEFLKILVARDAERLETLLANLPGLRAAFDLDPKQALNFWNWNKVRREPIPRLAHLLRIWPTPAIELMCRNLRLSKKFSRGVPNMVELCREANGDLKWSADIRLLLAHCAEREVPPGDVLDALIVADQKEKVYRIIRQMDEGPAVKLSDLALKGEDVVRITGCSPKEIGPTLRRLLLAVIDDPHKNTKKRLEEELLSKMFLDKAEG